MDIHIRHLCLEYNFLWLEHTYTNTASKKNEEIKATMPLTIHKRVFNVSTVLDPTQITTNDKYMVNNKN